jgi:predicted enzyme related to lactoylglutathione lyase
MNMKIEMVPVPVTDVDRAKVFYAEQLGWPVDVDHAVGDDFRLVQLTPPGSGCSIGIGIGVSRMVPGALIGLQLVVDDIAATRDELVGRGVDVTPVFHYEGTTRVDGPGGRWNSFAEFADPDGNLWVLQEQG